jgi:hypothetical protein
MKKSTIRKTITMVIAFILIFAFTTTAFAWDWATWHATKCKYGFTTTHAVDKLSDETWEFIVVYCDYLEFATPPFSYNLWCTPKSSSGAAVAGDAVWISPTTAPWIGIEEPYTTTCNHIYLRIDNPNPGNNAESRGEWDGYLIGD